MIGISTQAQRGPQDAAPGNFSLTENAHGKLVHFVSTHSGAPLTSRGEIKSERPANRIIPHLHAKCAFRIVLAEMTQSPMRHLSTCNPAPLKLLELITIDWVVQKIGKVVKKLYPVTLHITGHTRGIVGPGSLPVPDGAVAKGLATVVWFDKAEAVDQAAIDRALGNLIGRMPV